MKEIYESPVVEIVEVNTNDIIFASGCVPAETDTEA